MVGAVRPASWATSVKWARNGIPEGFPLGKGFTLRVVIPWPKARVDAAVIHKKSRRVMMALLIIVAAAEREQHRRTLSESANHPSYCAVPSFSRTPQQPFAFDQSECRVAPAGSERRAAWDRA